MLALKSFNFLPFFRQNLHVTSIITESTEFGQIDMNLAFYSNHCVDEIKCPSGYS